MFKKFYMYSVLDVKYILKTEKLQNQLLDWNWLLLAARDVICGFSYVENVPLIIPAWVFAFSLKI